MIFPHQIQGLDYGTIQPVLQWLTKKLVSTRDIRTRINRRQGLLNYRIKFEPHHHDKASEKPIDPTKMKQIIFNGKPKRAYRANVQKDVSFSDPKRVHTALREFNDLSANKVFQGILEQIQQLESE